MASLADLLPASLDRFVSRDRRAASRSRILVVGTEQDAAIATTMNCFVPDVDLAFLPVRKVVRRYPKLPKLLAGCDAYDAVFANVSLSSFYQGDAVEILRRHPRVKLIPTIAFSAFHPDLVRVGPSEVGKSDGSIEGPMGRSHSALVLFGFLSGLSQGEVLRLFRREVFERVGYFHFWETSVHDLKTWGRAAGFELGPHLARWMQRGCFMHSVHQVKLYVAADLALGLLDRAGIIHYPFDLAAYVPDKLGEAASWPVYPEIAEHYGVPGSALFLRPLAHRRGHLSPTLSLETFIAASFACYAQRPRDMLTCRRITEWRDNNDLRSALCDLATTTRCSFR